MIITKQNRSEFRNGIDKDLLSFCNEKENITSTKFKIGES